MRQLLPLIYSGANIIITEEVIESTASYLLHALFNAGNIDLTEIDWKSPDQRMLRIMRNNVYHFAGVKTFHQVRDLRALLIDRAKGSIRPFQEYKELFGKVVKQYNETWMKSEYEHAYQSARQGAKYQEFQQTKNRYNIMYDAVGDGNTTPLCRDLDGKVFAPDSSQLDMYMPPNHWGCRSTIKRVLKREYPVSDLPANLPVPEGIFDNNVGKTGIVFPPSHPYFKINSKAKGFVRERVEQLIVRKFGTI